MKAKSLKPLLALVLLISALARLNAQIAIAPTFVFIDERSGVGNLFVSNNGKQPHEVDISFAFGYPGSDSDGNLVMIYNDTAAFAQHALDHMIRAFPRNFVLQAGEQRTVRIQVIPGQQRREGFFYTRLKVLAKPQLPELSQQVEEGITTRIAFNFEQVTAVFYRRGKVSTGIEVKQLEVKQNGQTLELRPHLRPLGNAPYMGSMVARLIDANGRVIAENQSTTTAYFDVIRRIDLSIAGVAPGKYSIELSFETRRNDMISDELVQAQKVTHTSDVEVR